MIEPRVIRSRQGVKLLPPLISSIYAAEIIKPSSEIYLVSPWITDIVVLDNSAGQFATVAPDWPLSTIRLSEVFQCLAAAGSDIRIACRNDVHCQNFRASIAELKRNHSPSQVKLATIQDLHEKGLLGDGYYLHGSFNFTHAGVNQSDEVAQYFTDPTYIAENRIQFRYRFQDEVQ